MSCIPEREPIKERFRIMIRELQNPGLSAVCCLIDSRFFALPCTHEIGGICIDSMHVPKIEVGCAWNRPRFPMSAAVSRSKEGSVIAAGPSCFQIKCTYTAQANLHVGLLFAPSRVQHWRHAFSRGRVCHSRGHLRHHFQFRKTVPTVPFSGTIAYSRVSWGIGFLKKVIEQVNRSIQVIAVRISHRNMNLSPQLGTERGPVLLEYHAEIVFFPMVDNRLIDVSGFSIPQWHRPTVIAPGSIRCIPGSPLLAGHGP